MNAGTLGKEELDGSTQLQLMKRTKNAENRNRIS
jgi:hypothetical protein